MASESLPTASEDRLVLYLLGSGYGESQVVLLPGREKRVLVVDSSMSRKGGRNLTAELLRRLEVKKVDLLVITHADEDHVDGMPELIDEFAPSLLWYSPFVSSLRGLLSQWRREDPTNERYLALAETIQRIDRLKELDHADMVMWNSNSWGYATGGCVVHPIAPANEDDVAISSKLKKMFAREEGKRWIVSDAGRALLDGDKSPGDKPNSLSIALALRWGQRSILLSGDVENTIWSRVLRKLGRPPTPRIGLVEHLDVVKVAHHGSDGAFHEDAWCAHRKVDGSTLAFIAPYNRNRKLPDQAMLRGLARHAARLGLTADAGDGFSRASAAGWTYASGDGVEQLPDADSTLAVTLSSDGSLTLHASPEARFFTAAPPAAPAWAAGGAEFP